MKSHPITLEEIEAAMRAALAKESRTPGEIDSYVDAQKMHGWLRPDISQEVRKTVVIFYALPPSAGLP